MQCEHVCVCSVRLEWDFMLWWRCGVGFLCVGGPHMASAGRGKGRRREKMTQRGGKPKMRAISVKEEKIANQWKENDEG